MVNVPRGTCSATLPAHSRVRFGVITERTRSIQGGRIPAGEGVRAACLGAGWELPPPYCRGTHVSGRRQLGQVTGRHLGRSRSRGGRWRTLAMMSSESSVAVTRVATPPEALRTRHARCNGARPQPVFDLRSRGVVGHRALPWSSLTLATLCSNVMKPDGERTAVGLHLTRAAPGCSREGSRTIRGQRWCGARCGRRGDPGAIVASAETKRERQPEGAGTPREGTPETWQRVTRMRGNHLRLPCALFESV
jgi:hypothetical protein